MALLDNEEGVQPKVEQKESATIKVNKETMGARAGVGKTSTSRKHDTTAMLNQTLGFDGGEIFTLAASAGGEYTNKIAEEINETYNKNSVPVKPRVSVFDKDVLQNGLPYSCIVVHMMKQNICNYFIILLGATGEKPMTAKEIVDEIYIARNTPDREPFIFTIDEEINEYLHEEIQTSLLNEYKTDIELRSVDGVVVPYQDNETEQLSVRLAAMGLTACNVDLELVTGAHKDLNIAAAVEKDSDAILKFETNLKPQTVRDEVDKPVRSDFIVDLIKITKGKGFRSTKAKQRRKTLVEFSGYVESVAVPFKKTIATQQGYVEIDSVKLKPTIVLTNNSVSTPTLGFVMLSVASATVMSDDNMWLQTIVPKEDKPLADPGYLNILTNTENDPSGLGKPIALASKNVPMEKRYAVLREMHTQDVHIAYDVESYGPQTYYTSTLVVAASSDDREERDAARAQIIDTCVWLTNGRFKENFPIDSIFLDEGVILPMGRWDSKNGEKDIRAVDLAMVATQSKDPVKIRKYIDSGLPNSITGRDSFIERSELIADIGIGDAEIYGKYVRLTFTPEFIEELSASIAEAGLRVDFEPQIIFEEKNSISMLSNHFAGPGVHGAGTFARPNRRAASNYFTQTSSMGHGRY